MMNTTTGERIRKCRQQERFTLRELADQVGISDKTLMRFEKGERQPNADRLRALAQALNTTVSYLTGETDDPTPAGRATSGITQSVTGIGNISGNISNNMIASTMTAPTEFPEAISPEPKPQTPWWIDAVTKAYEMERTQDVRAMEAARALQLALDVLERTASQVTTA